MTIDVELTSQQAEALVAMAKRLNVSAAELAAAAVRDLIARQDGEFEAAAKRVMEKNDELYKRLS